MFRIVVSCAALFVGLSNAPLESAMQRSRVPNAILEVTIQQKEGQQVGKGLHLLQLFCRDGDCSLTTLSLNQCGELGDGTRAFYPKIGRTSTREGNLVVNVSADVLVIKETDEDSGGDYVTTLRIGFERDAAGGPATKITSFTGGFVKNSTLLKKVITVEYVPLKGVASAIRLDCAVLTGSYGPRLLLSQGEPGYASKG